MHKPENTGNKTVSKAKTMTDNQLGTKNGIKLNYHHSDSCILYHVGSKTK